MKLGFWAKIPKPKSNKSKMALVAILFLVISVVTVIADSHDLRVIAAAFVIPAVAAVHFWNLKRAIPVLLAVPVVNELLSFGENWYSGTDVIQDPAIGNHMLGSISVILIAVAYSAAIRTSRSLTRELKLREASEARESLRASQQSILARMSREIGSIEHPERMKRQIATFMYQLASPDSVIIYERIEELGGWVEIAQSGAITKTTADSIPNSVSFENFTEIDTMISPTWVPDDIAGKLTTVVPISTHDANQHLIVPIRWRSQSIAFVVLTYKSSPAPDSQQIYLLQQAAWQIAGSLAGSIVYQKAVDLGFRLEKEAQARDRMASVVSHEMRTPLTAAVAMNDLLLRDNDKNLNDRQIQKLTVIRRNLQRIIAVSDDLLESSRMRSGGFELFSEHANLVQIINDAVANFRPVADGFNQHIELDLPENPVVVHADVSRLSQVVTNFLSNASKFSSHGKSIQVTFASNHETARIEVIDQGSGIGSDEISHIFDWAFQSDQKQSTGKHGAGIGLFVSKAIVDAHGGKIGVESLPGGNTVAWFEVPIIESAQSTSTPATLEHSFS
ncbi:MAG: ATP-binding protein [Chloroflexi bacterium]|nr:ATP-binding protein [Chloroflexota bacterium]